MRSSAKLAFLPIVVACVNGAFGQSEESRVESDFTVPQAVVRSPRDRDGSSVETRLLRIDCDVALEQAQIAHQRAKRALSNPESSPTVAIHRAGDLLEKLVAWQQLAQQLGRDTPEFSKLQRQLTRLRVAVAKLEADKHRHSYGQTTPSVHASPALPAAASYLRLQRGLDLAVALMDLADKQAQLLADVGAPKTEMQELNGQLRQRKKQIDAKINKNLQDPTTADLDQLVADVQELVTEANQLVTRADEIAGTNLGTPTVETMNALDLTRSVLVSSGKLIQDARGAPAPEQSETRLKQLLTRRLALLRDELMRVRRRAQLTQIVTWLEVADVSERVLNAELELCQTRLERIARRQRHLEQFRKFEAQVLAEIRSGRGQAAVSDPAHVEIRRLKFEIELQRELIREPPEKKSVEAAVEQGKLPGW